MTIKTKKLKKVSNILLLKNVLLTIQPYISKIHLDFITSKEYLYEIINKFVMINVIKYKKKLHTII